MKRQPDNMENGAVPQATRNLLPMEQRLEEIEIDLNRFEADADGGLAFASYRLSPGTVTIVHTEVPATMRGSGVGSALSVSPNRIKRSVLAL